MKIKTIIIFLILFLSSSNILGRGLGDWAAYTKNKTYFNSPGGGTIITLTNGKKYENPDKWFFYKNNIIGVGKEWIEERYEYEFFVINETEGEIHIFEQEELWKNFINANELNPQYWKRWFSDNWNHIKFVKLLAILWFPISIPIILLNIYFFYNLAKFDKTWKKWITLAAITPTIILMLNVLGRFPESF